jgi:caa(3)-type oxidase subunit IV|uniref:cytochrome C oxidase subunit IV family protein n=1 Tax=Prosthecobacter sp. TaxID=1965333 RepID=UPI0037844C1F
MSDNIEEIQKSVRKYIIIGVALLALSGFTVWLSTVELPTHGLNILVGMIVATFKASLVALIFMHLNHERPVIYKVLAFTVVLALVLFVLFVLSARDPLVFEGFYNRNE